MWVYGTVNNIIFIYKNVGFLENGYTKVSKVIPQINNLPHTGVGRKKLEPYVAVSTILCFLEYQPTGFVLAK